jgi:D-alanyl-D-alanine carboxypeptidase/D-alanyl-D-alanine-endopeptidase (penicillin-binding protein 4)
LQYDGIIDHQGILNGNIYIKGHGDPTLGSGRFPNASSLDDIMNLWFQAIKKCGIRQISGHIIGNDSYFDDMPLPGQWTWDDIGNYYAPLTSGLCINENLYYLYFEPASQVGEPARVLRTEPAIPDLNFINNIKTGKIGSGDKGYIYGAPRQWQQQLEGTIPAGVKEFSIKGSIPDPAKFAAMCLRRFLLKQGAQVTGEALSTREISNITNRIYTIDSTSSPELKEIIYQLNKKSINLYAEQLLKILAKKVHGISSFQNGVDTIIDWLNTKGINTDTIFLYDGSGLSRSNRVSTRLLVELLVSIIHEPFFDDFYRSLPIAGDTTDIGTMRNKCIGTRAAGNLRAKTGQHLRVCAHSGYVFTKSNELIAFSMIANDHLGSYSQISKLHEKIMIELANLP